VFFLRLVHLRLRNGTLPKIALIIFPFTIAPGPRPFIF
jgi:hypothetical protein